MLNEFRVLGKYKDCLTRQLKEAIRVQNRPDNLNSKGEFGGGTIPRLVVEKSDWESKVDMIERAKREAEEDNKWETFMAGRGHPSKSNESVMTKTDIQDPVSTDGNYDSTDSENTNQIIKYRSNTTTETLTTSCPTVQDNEAHTHSAETIHPITAGAVLSTPCPVGQDLDLGTSVPYRSSKVKVRGGRRGKGSQFMTVKNISDSFKEISAKNKILEQLSVEGGPGGSPKRKIDFKNSDTDSPSKKSKFESMCHFLKQLMGETNWKPGSQENILGQSDDGIFCEQLED